MKIDDRGLEIIKELPKCIKPDLKMDNRFDK